MNRHIARIALSALALSAAHPLFAATPPVDTLDARDPAVTFNQFAEMGYAPEYPEPGKKSVVVLNSGSDRMLAIFGGCTAERDCSYIVLYGQFTDEVTLDSAALNKLNADYDFIKVYFDDSHKLAFTMGLQAQGLTRSHFRASVDGFLAAKASLAQDLLKAGAVKAEPEKH